MKAWLCLHDGTKRADGWMGTVYATEEDARAIHGRVVEVEIPDPPHVWKVNDWFINRQGDGTPCRIVDMTTDEFAYTYRHPSAGEPRGDWSQVWMLETECDPCDPPEWWEGDR